MKRYAIVVLLLVFTFIATLPGSEVRAEGAGTVTVNLAAQNNSGQSGTATIKDAEGKANVTISIGGFSADVSQPAHIHFGSCASLGGVAYGLANVVNGTSTTALDVNIATLKTKLPLAVNVHKSIAESGVYVACGDVKIATSVKTFDPVCMQNAVDKRDTALIAALDVYHASAKTLLETRRSELKIAWAKTDAKERRTAIKSVWKKYRDALRAERKKFRNAKRAAWKQYGADRRICKGEYNSDDALGQGADETL